MMFIPFVGTDQSLEGCREADDPKRGRIATSTLPIGSGRVMKCVCVFVRSSQDGINRQVWAQTLITTIVLYCTVYHIIRPVDTSLLVVVVVVG
jgi:hypothetical protein